MIRGNRIQRIILADSHQLYRTGLRTLIANEADLDVIGEATHIGELLAELAGGADAVIMDLGLLAEADDFQMRELRNQQGRSPFLFLAREDTPAALELAMRAGGSGYMSKSSPVSQIMAGIRRVASGSDQSTLATADLRALADSGERFPRTSPLTDREQEVMRLIAEGRTVRETAAELALSMKTVEAHKLNLMRKLKIHSQASLVQYAMAQGVIPGGIAA